MNGRPAIVGMVRGVLVVHWVDANGEIQRARVWAKELEGAEWRESLRNG